MRFSSFLMFSCATLSLLAGANAYAQEIPAEEVAGNTEIIVTAQRRSESAQDVPIALTAYSGEQMEALGLSSSADLTAVVPGLTMNPSAARSPTFLRGVGNNTYSTSPSVLTFIDGVYQPFDNTGADYSNVERIEVLRGPQGTLFGRNATGGVIQIITRDPSVWQGLEVDLGFANFDTTTTNLYGATRLSEAVAADLAVFYLNQEEGWGVNVFNGDDIYDQERYGFRSKVVFDIDSTFRATLTGDYANRRGSNGLAISPSTFNETLYDAVSDSTFTLPSIYDINSDLQPYFETQESGVSLTLDKDFGGLNFLSITSLRHADEEFAIDFDGTPNATFTNNRQDERDAFTQEFQLSGQNGPLSWVGGLYYYYAKSEIDGPHLGGTQPIVFFGFTPFDITSEDTTNAYAAYLQGTWAITDATNLTLGARYTVEQREIEGVTDFDPAGSSESETFNEPNYRVAIDHQLTPNMMLYASWSRSFNAGFFNQLSAAGFDESVNPVVEPETIESIEVGVKSDLFLNRLRVNVAAFSYEYENLQQSIYGPFGITTLNAAGAEIQGVDVEIVARPTDDLTLSLGANFLETEYTSYPLAPNYDFLPNGAFVAVGTQDAQGNEIVQAPPLGIQAAATYTLNTSFGVFDTTLSVNYQDRQYADAQNEITLTDRTLVGLNERWTSADGNTYVMLWGKNLTDEEYDYSLSLLEPTGPVGNPAPPRTYGITVGHTF